MIETTDLTLREYQSDAAATDQVPDNDENKLQSIMVPLLGLAGETGSLLTEFKKYMRQGDIYRPFEQQVAEELGDILWYVSNIASKMGLDLEEVARLNLSKLDDRYRAELEDHAGQRRLFESQRSFDDGYPENERLPRTILAEFHSVADGSNEKLHVTLNGVPCGDPLTDNSHVDDGYRFHDVFHLTMCCRLGWSPILRKLLGCKRKSERQVDEVEDGARAGITEEAISAVAYGFAKDFSLFNGANSVEFSLLRTIKSMTSSFEVRVCSYREWESVILEAFSVWRMMMTCNGGVFIGTNARVEYQRHATAEGAICRTSTESSEITGLVESLGR